MQQYSTFFTYPNEKLVETVGTAVTILKGVLSDVAHLDTVKFCITVASVSFHWIRMTGFPLHHQRIEDEIVRSVKKIHFLGGASGRMNQWMKQLGRRL